LLQQELREPRNYFAILEAIASGRTKLNEIKQATGLDGATAYLDTLQGLRLIERFVPVTEAKPHKSRRGLYRLCDPFFRFWFRFVHPNRTLLEQGGAEIGLQNFVLPQLNDFTGLVWEEICRQFLWQQSLAGKLPFIPTRIGGWWRKNSEIDIIALNDTHALLVECKWSLNPVGTDILQKLEAKVPQVEGLDKRQLHFGLCARSGFTPQLVESVAGRNDVLLFGLEDIVGGLAG
jgi:AAA+ ATPase superfamily predicted ATPase